AERGDAGRPASHAGDREGSGSDSGTDRNAAQRSPATPETRCGLARRHYLDDRATRRRGGGLVRRAGGTLGARWGELNFGRVDDEIHAERRLELLEHVEPRVAGYGYRFGRQKGEIRRCALRKSQAQSAPVGPRRSRIPHCSKLVRATRSTRGAEQKTAARAGGGPADAVERRTILALHRRKVTFPGQHAVAHGGRHVQSEEDARRQRGVGLREANGRTRLTILILIENRLPGRESIGPNADQGAIVLPAGMVVVDERHERRVVFVEPDGFADQEAVVGDDQKASVVTVSVADRERIADGADPDEQPDSEDRDDENGLDREDKAVLPLSPGRPYVSHQR